MRAPDVIRPESLAEATEILRLYGDTSKVVSGSTAMTIMLRQNLIAPDELVTISHLDGMGDIDEVAGVVRLGALVKHRQVERSPTVLRTTPVLAHTFGKVANVRIRNAATVGGVLAEADYASDPPSVFVGMDATVECVSPDGERTIPIADFFQSFYETSLEHEEILTAVNVPIPAAGTEAVYNKFVSRAAEDRPCVGVFASARAEDGVCADLRVVVGAAAETPYRVLELEALGTGTTLSDAVIKEIAESYADGIDALDDMRGSAWYRREMVRVWVTRSLAQVRDASRVGQSTERSSS
jgi:carbon-monoxide dehydrogenase medium subunit